MTAAQITAKPDFFTTVLGGKPKKGDDGMSKVLDISGVADHISLKVLEQAFAISKSLEPSKFMLEYLTLTDVTDEGCIRYYKGCFKSFKERKKIEAQVILSRNFRRTQGVTTPTSEWSWCLTLLTDTENQWEYILGAKVLWIENVPSFEFSMIEEPKPTKSYLSDTAYTIDPHWGSSEGYRTAVFCPDLPPGDRLHFFGNEILARAYVKLTDPNGTKKRRINFPDACSTCGNQLDALNECGNECWQDSEQ